MSDGSTMGIAAGRAIETLLGSKESPTDEESQTREQVLARIKTATPTDYSGATDVIARVMLRVIKSDPSKHDWPLEKQYDWNNGNPIIIDHRSLWDAAAKIASPSEKEAFDGASGFMAGFAYNQVRWLLGEPPTPNPAILEI